MNSTNALRRVVAELELPTSRVILAVLAGSGALGSAVALLACSAWLIARAAQQPPMMELTLVIVAVRGLGIGRGLFRYLERLISHDLPLRGLVHIRGRCYAALAGAPTRVVLGLRRGDLVDRMGTDIDTLADVLVRGVLPFAVAATVGTASAVFSGIVLAESGVTLAVGLLVAGAVAPLLAARAATPTRAQADSTTEVVTLAQTMIESAAELEVSGGRQELRDQLNDAEQRRVRSRDAGTGRRAQRGGGVLVRCCGGPGRPFGRGVAGGRHVAAVGGVRDDAGTACRGGRAGPRRPQRDADSAAAGLLGNR